MKLKFYLLLSFLSLFFFSCSKEKSTDSIRPETLAAISIHHCAPNTPNLGISINGQNLQLSQFGYRTRTNYFNLFPGTYQFVAYQADRSPALPYLSTNIALFANQTYSLFLINSLFKIEPLLIKDDTTPATKGKVKVRFANLSTDMEPIDFYSSSNENAIVKNLAYKQVSDFYEFDADQQVEFSVKYKNGEEWIPSPSMLNKKLFSALIKLDAKKNFYTIALMGLKNAENVDGELIIESFAH